MFSEMADFRQILHCCAVYGLHGNSLIQKPSLVAAPVGQGRSCEHSQISHAEWISDLYDWHRKAMASGFKPCSGCDAYLHRQFHGEPVEAVV